VGHAFVVAAAVLLVLAVRARREERALRTRGIVTPGRVVDEGEETGYAVIGGVAMPVTGRRFSIQFFDEEGRSRTRPYSNPRERDHDGDTVTVIYDRDASARARVLRYGAEDVRWNRRPRLLFALAARSFLAGVAIILG
jgi:hypothetical protein